MAASKKQSFEQRLEALESTVRTLEAGGVPLAESLKLYEAGAALAASLEEELTAAQQRLTVLRQGPDGTSAEEPLTLGEER